MTYELLGLRHYAGSRCIPTIPATEEGGLLMSRSTLCPVCGFDLGFAAWNDESPSHEICPCCGIQFGYGDATPGGVPARTAIYSEWRAEWQQAGMPWRDQSKPPQGWNPAAQLAALQTS